MQSAAASDLLTDYSSPSNIGKAALVKSDVRVLVNAIILFIRASNVSFVGENSQKNAVSVCLGPETNNLKVSNFSLTLYFEFTIRYLPNLFK